MTVERDLLRLLGEMPFLDRLEAGLAAPLPHA